MSDLKLDQVSGDLVVENGDLVLTTGEDAIRQHVQQRLRTFLGEWFLDTGVGVPWFQDILKKNPNPQIVDGLIQNEIIQTPGVVELLKYESDFDRSLRKLSVSVQFRTVTGVINFEELFGA